MASGHSTAWRNEEFKRKPRTTVPSRGNARPKELRGMVLKMVARQFGGVPTCLAERLAEVTDPGQLDLLADAALTAGSIELFLQQLDGKSHP